MRVVKACLMSALGQKRTFAVQKGMSALPPKADICSALAHVCFGPIADICSLDDDVHALQKPVWNTQAYGFRSLEVDGQLEFCRLFYRQVFRLLAL
jgi:hypothetical protein